MRKNDITGISPWDPLLALVLLTRLPLPRLPDSVFARQAAAIWAFPLAGLAVGALICVTGWLAQAVGLSAWIAAGLMLAVSVMVTGAMHEDGLADTADGLWGGFTAERRLEIMKDSHIGTYGVLALILSQLLRLSALAALVSAGALWSLLAAAIWSRALMPVVMTALPNARGAGLSQSVGRPAPQAVGLGLALAAALVVAVMGAAGLGPALLSAVAVLGLGALAKAKIGGQTGDILGASQQLAEIVFLLALAAQLS
ncbi:adenosylcobinamide-GDP ribazoletransferase [Ruegeria aquimaris]|uniref:Adenosylcobinamide-GDP ribazoletransferase n=1 Tax=Ruegeria aquimaris TaxID=2984333 RepID=A0ABT3ALG1_9RHOB|nr:adenosylcobinamide-GDP ribazoletransferase [Ruegeria sp. XHP0148]MCV2889489.1 adenosylcobinamide-GDP ribazoletransferase [Ruegeria sp. XHP0148]